MSKAEVRSMVQHFSSLPDPRIERSKEHSLTDIIVIAICAVICGADGWVSVEEWGNSKESWLRRFLKLPNGIPSHDTFGRVFAALDGEAFRRCFTEWIGAATGGTGGQIVPIDGKTLRRSFDRASNKAAIHMVSAWASRNRIALGQVKTEEKSNEITAIPKLLEMLDLRGCIVTIDAMGCQKKIVDTIVERTADYVLAVKGNQPQLEEDLVFSFVEAEAKKWRGVQRCETSEHGHGREEIRRYYLSGNLSGVTKAEDWANLSAIGMVETQRRVAEKTSTERRYYISSLPCDDVQRFAESVRTHWSVENDLHWTLDVQFDEDQCRIRKGNGAENFAVLRHIALGLLKQERTSKVGIANKRLKAGWDDAYLLKVLGV